MISSLEELESILDGATWLCFDFETDGVHPITSKNLGISLLTDRGGGYLPLAPYRTIDSPLLKEALPLDEIAALLKEKALFLPSLAWNAKFDMHCMQRWLGEVPKKIIDPMVGYWLLNEEGSMALKDVLPSVAEGEFPSYKDIEHQTRELLHKEIEEQREAYAQLAPKGKKLTYRREAVDIFPMRAVVPQDIPLEYMAPYSYRDVVATAYLWFYYIRPNLQKQDLLGYFYSYEMPFLRVLFEMEHEGVRVNVHKLKELEREGKERVEALIIKINTFAGYEINPNATAQLNKMLFEEHSFEPPSKRTKKGEISLDKNALRELHWRYGRLTSIFDWILEYRKETKLIQTYYIGLREETIEGNIHGNFKQTGTQTGRLSSSQPNLQNLPRGEKTRGVFEPSPGCGLIKADFNQAELRILADRTEDPLLLEVYREGRDIHAETMIRLNIKERRLAKIINFSVSYETGPGRYQQTLFFENKVYRSFEQCKKDIEIFNKTYQNVPLWKKEVIKHARRTGFVLSRLGRRRHAIGIHHDDYSYRLYSERQIINFLIQGDVADIMKVAMIMLQKVLRPLGGRILIQVHDELLIEAPLVFMEEARGRVQSVMESAFSTLLVPILADVEVGPNWGTTKK